MKIFIFSKNIFENTMVENIFNEDVNKFTLTSLPPQSCDSNKLTLNFIFLQFYISIYIYIYIYFLLLYMTFYIWVFFFAEFYYVILIISLR